MECSIVEIDFGKEEGIGFQELPLFLKSSGVVYVLSRWVAGRWFHWKRQLKTVKWGAVPVFRKLGVCSSLDILITILSFCFQWWFASQVKMSPEVALNRISPMLSPFISSVVRNGKVGLDATNCLRITDLKSGYVIPPIKLLPNEKPFFARLIQIGHRHSSNHNLIAYWFSWFCPVLDILCFQSFYLCCGPLFYDHCFMTFGEHIYLLTEYHVMFHKCNLQSLTCFLVISSVIQYAL